jgi:hypothetical protein
MQSAHAPHRLSSAAGACRGIPLVRCGLFLLLEGLMQVALLAVSAEAFLPLAPRVRLLPFLLELLQRLLLLLLRPRSMRIAAGRCHSAANQCAMLLPVPVPCSVRARWAGLDRKESTKMRNEGRTMQALHASSPCKLMEQALAPEPAFNPFEEDAALHPLMVMTRCCPCSGSGLRALAPLPRRGQVHGSPACSLGIGSSQPHRSSYPAGSQPGRAMHVLQPSRAAAVRCAAAAASASSASAAAAAAWNANAAAWSQLLTASGIFLLCVAAAIFLFVSLPAAVAWARVAMRMNAVLKLVEQELPESAALLKLSGMGVNEAITEFSGLSSELTNGLRSTANLVTMAETGVKQGITGIQHGLVPMATQGEKAARGRE